jgi:aryl-alcohol dehydrogenase-like predicted oxidoreductase
MNATGFAVLDELTSVARSYHSTPAAVALAWLAQQPTITSALASVSCESMPLDYRAQA